MGDGAKERSGAEDCCRAMGRWVRVSGVFGDGGFIMVGRVGGWVRVLGCDCVKVLVGVVATGL